MKRWTVMLIPQDRGGTQTFSLAAYHFWIAIVLLAGLTFASAFFYQRHRVVSAQARELHEQYRAIQWELSLPAAPSAPVEAGDTVTKEELERIRREYEASIATITAELSELYDMEAKARDITGIAPREKPAEDGAAPAGGGQGGAPSGYTPVAYLGVNNQYRPPHVIYGMNRPSADLILQEIRLRHRSLNELVRDGEAAQDKLARIPSIWPLWNGAGKLTSRFGYRRDPFHRRVRHHDGTDLAAPTGTKVISTARGEVTFAEYDQYYGNLVKVDHGNGIETWYAHLSKVIAKPGDRVDRGMVIGHLGSTGRSTGPHLHYEVRVNGKPVDGEKYLSE